MVLPQRARLGFVASAWLLSAVGASGQTLTSPNSESAGGFGFSVSGVPDVNGDGRGEMAVGAPNENHAGVTDAGRAYLYSGQGARKLTLVSPSPESGGQFGYSVSGVPDVHGDGKGDLAVGAPGELGGRVYVFSGATGARRLTLTASIGVTDARFGAAVAGLADVTGDGFGDVVVGAPQVSQNGDFFAIPSGMVYIFNGYNGKQVRSMGTPSGQTSTDFGSAVAGVPDTNGDGRPDLVVGAPREDIGITDAAGRVYVYSGATGQLLHMLTSPNARPNGLFGSSVAGVPDANGDGVGDIVVGAPDEIVGNNPVGAGRAYLFSGKTGALLRQFAVGNPQANDHFGSSVAGVVDLNGDGRGDIIVGAKGKTVPGSPGAAGRVYVFSGATGAYVRSFVSPRQEAGGAFGGAVAGLDDINGDGRGDLGVGARNEDVVGKTGAGRAYMIRY